MEQHEPRKSREFARYLDGLAKREDRAALAALRRGLGKQPGEAAEMFPYLARWSMNPWEEDTYYLTASLFALHPASWSGDQSNHNFGASLAWLNRNSEGAGVERRLVAMLNADRDTLPDHLRHAVALLKGKEISVDWACLIEDLNGWEHESRYVQRRWARSFWGDQPITSEREVSDQLPVSSDSSE